MTLRFLGYLMLAPVSLSAQERYGFVALLGRDTISVERITRTANRLVSDQVERFSQVLTRHTELTLAPDGTFRRLTMDIVAPNATTAVGRGRHLTAVFGTDSLWITDRTSDTTKRVALATKGLLTVPWVSQLYSFTEQYFAAALSHGGDTVAVQLFFPEEEIERQQFYPSSARRLSDGRMEVIARAALAGIGEGRLDARRRMVSYSGARTTYRMEVARVAASPDIEAIVARFAATERAQGIMPELSNRDTTRADIGTTTLLVDYGRPLARGRELLGNVVPYGTVWRTGANAATQFTTSAAITLAGLDLAPGTYTLWTLPSPSGSVLIVNRQIKQWGTQYDPTKDLGRAPLTVGTTATPAERFTISVAATGVTTGTLVMEWGSFRWTAPIAVK